MARGRPKGVPELESGWVRHEVWKRVASYLANHPKLTLEEIRTICLPIVVKTMPEKLETDGLANIFQVIVKGFEGVNNVGANRLREQKLDAIQS